MAQFQSLIRRSDLGFLLIVGGRTRKYLTALAIVVLASANARAGDPKEEEVFPSFNSAVVIHAANLTWVNYGDWWSKTQGTRPRYDVELPTNLWADGIARLKPQYVYTHGVNAAGVPP